MWSQIGAAEQARAEYPLAELIDETRKLIIDAGFDIPETTNALTPAEDRLHKVVQDLLASGATEGRSFHPSDIDPNDPGVRLALKKFLPAATEAWHDIQTMLWGAYRGFCAAHDCIDADKKDEAIHLLGNAAIKLSQSVGALMAEKRQAIAANAANAKHNAPDGSRSRQDAIRRAWASGKYSSRDICAEQECAALGMSFSAARKALRNTPDPP
ncbi:hypothetical protein RKE25_09895 [Dyella sp. BiH032]|uniref:hypothetical protein n=1 Tax=Dyella sp. BiH032 TaxID=3075430 RepID=UPI0028932FFD|nr:hypothetical protein [Dyella sp. BiH032]WNL47911.1 hypothetical protein RKE25_09895 [Dyella sp. BiH032]